MTLENLNTRSQYFFTGIEKFDALFNTSDTRLKNTEAHKIVSDVTLLHPVQAKFVSTLSSKFNQYN